MTDTDLVSSNVTGIETAIDTDIASHNDTLRWLWTRSDPLTRRHGGDRTGPRQFVRLPLNRAAIREAP